ncbi:MAG: HTH domain-containing protein [Candidatus Nezhaarchaeales archaeon]
MRLPEKARTLYEQCVTEHIIRKLKQAEGRWVSLTELARELGTSQFMVRQVIKKLSISKEIEIAKFGRYTYARYVPPQ